MTAEDFQNGQVLLIDKPLHWTSFQAVNKMKWALKSKLGLKKIKIGHAGTLDPLASGLLLPSYDLETEINETFPISHINDDLIYETTKQFLGEIDQKPPIFSAIKKDGKRLYEHARAGEEVEIAFRKTTIHKFEITRIALPEVDFRVVCSKGTYIRSLAYDFGIALKSGAHLTALRRTKIGDYNVENAIDVMAFVDSLPKE